MLKLLVLCLVLSFVLLAQSSAQCNDVGAVATLNVETLGLGVTSTTVTADQDEKQTCTECQPNIQKFAGKPICQITCRRICEGESNRGIIDLSQFTAANSPLVAACSKKAPKGSKCLCYDLKQQLKETDKPKARMLANEINHLCKCKTDSYDAKYIRKAIKQIKKMVKKLAKTIGKAAAKKVGKAALKNLKANIAATTVEEVFAHQAEAEALQLSLEIENL